jgi:hypothetical protein
MTHRGLREAGVMQFIDRALGTFLAHLAADYRAQLAGVSVVVPRPLSRRLVVRVARFQRADRLSENRRSHALLRSDAAADAARDVHIPEYGGNRDGLGWTLIGFDAQHMFQPPFGYYDRDYPGFTAEPRLLEMSARRYKDSDTVDFVIVGSGAAGGVIARELSRAGLSVVVLEQGPRLQPGALEHDELKYWFLGGITNDIVHRPADVPARGQSRRPCAAA